MFTTSAWQRHLLIFGIVLLVNTLLFIVLPHFMMVQKMPQTMANSADEFRMVNVLRFCERKPAPAPNHPKQKVRPPEKQNSIAPEHFEMPLREIRPTAPDIALEPPSFDIHPRLTAGPPITFAGSGSSAVAQIDKTAAYDQAEVDQVPMSIVKTQPKYPHRARRLNLSGQVRVKFLVEPSGRVRDIQIIQADPPDVFDQSVISALSSWRFAPGRLQGRAVATWVTTTIVFRLEDAG